MCGPCRYGPDSRSHSPPATALPISPNGIPLTGRQNTAFLRPPPTRCPGSDYDALSRDTHGSTTMKDVFAKLATDNVVLATSVAIAGAVAQVVHSRIKGQELGFMTWASLALVIVLGSA